MRNRGTVKQGKEVKMRLREPDGRCVRITDCFGAEFEGICEYLGAEHSRHEYGLDRDALRIGSFLFSRRIIRKAESLEGHDGPWGRFSGPYGRIEELIAEDGADSVVEALGSEDPDLVIRLLRCLADRQVSPGDRAKIGRALLALTETGGTVGREAESLFSVWETGEEKGQA